MYLVVAERRRVGLIDLVLDHPGRDEATVALLAIVPEARRQGLATRAAEILFARLKSRGCRTVRLGVRRGALGAAEFWASLGMVESGRDGPVRQFVRAL